MCGSGCVNGIADFTSPVIRVRGGLWLGSRRKQEEAISSCNQRTEQLAGAALRPRHLVDVLLALGESFFGSPAPEDHS